MRFRCVRLVLVLRCWCLCCCCARAVARLWAPHESNGHHVLQGAQRRGGGARLLAPGAMPRAGTKGQEGQDPACILPSHSAVVLP
ncbi:MAG: hypothetical protein J3K34DRAFT_447764 [Monoraphidium minutum]|nr:MAG: hypothetical protein J3K34DRAFT_447764 [Monoraphidium minutum]